MDVYLSRSTDGGFIWRDYRINEHRFRPKTVSGSGGSGNQGDNIGVIYNNNKLWTLWMDDHTGVYQIWAAAIDLNTIGIRQISSAAPDKFGLDQNFPNPFNPGTVISYQLKTRSDVILKVYDISGKEVITLVNEKQNEGRYSATFNGSDLTSGIYFYKITAGDFTFTRKMVLVK